MAVGTRPFGVEAFARQDVGLAGNDSRISWIVRAGRYERLASVSFLTLPSSR
jgi:hypothetical protein